MRTLLVSGDSPVLLREEALATARQLLCPGHADRDSCPVCRRVRQDTHPDLFHLRADGAQIKVEDVRNAVRFAMGRPYEASVRLIWVEGAESLRDAGTNALLKSLEEPGESVQWLLTTASPESILATIRSRCVFRRLLPKRPSQLIADFEASGLSSADARDAAAFGFDPGQSFDLDAARESRRLHLGALAEGSVSALLALAAAAAEEDSASRLAASLLRDAAILSAGASSDRLCHFGAASELARVARVYPPAALREAARRADGLEEAFQRSRQKRLGFEGLFLRLRRAAAGQSRQAAEK
jgi:DNA polymerase III subunit delta'